jgi:hypothetical protein
MTDDCFEWENNLVAVAYAQMNDRGDLFDLRLQKNPYIQNNKVITLYALRKDICHTSKNQKEKE